MIFKIYECDFGVKISGITYTFTHVESLQIDDPEMTRLVRGANAADAQGIVYKEGIKEPKKITVTIKSMASDLKSVLDSCYADKTRVDVFCISRSNGSSKMAKDAILSQMPQQLSVDESADSMNVALAFESYNLSEVFKD